MRHKKHSNPPRLEGQTHQEDRPFFYLDVLTYTAIHLSRLKLRECKNVDSYKKTPRELKVLQQQTHHHTRTLPFKQRFLLGDHLVSRRTCTTESKKGGGVGAKPDSCSLHHSHWLADDSSEEMEKSPKRQNRHAHSTSLS